MVIVTRAALCILSLLWSVSGAGAAERDDSSQTCEFFGPLEEQILDALTLATRSETASARVEHAVRLVDLAKQGIKSSASCAPAREAHERELLLGLALLEEWPQVSSRASAFLAEGSDDEDHRATLELMLARAALEQGEAESARAIALGLLSRDSTRIASVWFAVHGVLAQAELRLNRPERAEQVLLDALKVGSAAVEREPLVPSLFEDALRLTVAERGCERFASSDRVAIQNPRSRDVLESLLARYCPPGNRMQEGEP